MYGRTVSRAYGHYQISCLLTLRWFFLNYIVLFKNHPAVVPHFRNCTLPWNNSVLQTFPGAQTGSAMPTIWPPQLETTDFPVIFHQESYTLYPTTGNPS